MEFALFNNGGLIRRQLEKAALNFEWNKHQ
mgnify:CR=1 FL=1|jgi:hypothetical protein